MDRLKLMGMVSITALGLLGSACNDDATPIAITGNGSLRLMVDLNTSVLSSHTPDSRADASSVDVNDLTLTLMSTDGQKSHDLGTLGTFDPSKKFPIGNYKLVASYSTPADQGFDKPHYYGESEAIAVREGETTEVSLTAALANSMFSVSYTNAVKNYLTAYSAEIITPASSVPLTYPADETRPVYVAAGDVEVFVNIEKPNGTKARLKAASVTAAPRHHYSVTIDINEGQVGDGILTVTFSDDLTDEDIAIELSDELLNAPAPEVVASVDSPVDHVETTANKTPLKYNVIARGQLGEVKLMTTNAAAISSQWPESIDLLKATDSQRSTMTDLGLNVLGLWNNPDKMAIIDLTKVVSNISGTEPVEFTLSVTDKMGKSSSPSVITVNITPIQLSVGNINKLYEGETTLKFDLVYNGDDPANNIVYVYKNERGTWSQTTALTCTPTEVDNTYNVTIPVPESGVFTFYAANLNRTVQTDQIDVIHVLSDTYTVSVTNTFATRATIDAVETVGDYAGRLYGAYATAFVSTDGATYTTATSTTDADGHLYISGLTPSTDYSVKVSLTGDIADGVEATFTTEAATQLANADMESWSQTGGNDYWTLWTPAGDWATLNALTTSQPGSNGYAWNAASSTVPVDGAARIATTGWGASNTAATRFLLSTTLHCANVTIGELFLGSYNPDDNTKTYGIDFASRPTSLSFKYKYTAKTSDDKGVAIIKVLDADGNTLASASANLAAASDYTTYTMDLDYGSSAVKAASLQVTFLSSNRGSISASTSNLNYPAVNTTDYTSRYYGSELFVDDIILNY